MARRATLIVGLLLIVPSSGFAALCEVQGNLIQNCGFESGLQSWTAFDLTGTSASSEFVNSGTTSAALATLAGSSGSISQSIVTDAGQAYLVSFWFMTDIGGTFEATWNGASMFSTVAPTSAPYSLFQFSVVGSGAADVLRLSATTPEPPDPGGDHTWYVDDVSVVATPTSVPEPASLTLLGAGLGVLAVTGRLRRRGFAAALMFALLLMLPSSGFAALCDVQGNLVQNCGFESGLQSWTTLDIVGTSTPSEFVNSGTTSAALATLAGSSGSISQSILTDAGQAYLVSFWFMTDIGGTFEATWNGASMFSTVAPTGAPYSLFQFSVVGSGAADVLRFSATTPPPPDPGGDGTWYADDVTVVATPTSVPEPASLTLLTGGLGAIGVARRLRRPRTGRFSVR